MIIFGKLKKNKQKNKQKQTDDSDKFALWPDGIWQIFSRMNFQQNFVDFIGACFQTFLYCYP